MTRSRLLALIAAMVCALGAHAISFSLDSIAEWGRFPRFVVNTYRWGDQFFNGFDTAYVKGTGYKFNIKLRSESWTDYYNFDLPGNIRMRMLSDPSTTGGVWLTYMAVTAGYDRNISHFFGGSSRVKNQYSFGFNCSLFTFNILYADNDVGTRISKFGPRGHTYNPNIPFDGASIKTLNAELYYFFNHKKYSQAAAFSYGRVQTKSQGSWFAGLAFTYNDFKFDFSELPQYMKDAFPPTWTNDLYHASVRNYCVKAGYGYNWVFAKNWCLGAMAAPVVGVRKGFVNSEFDKTSFAMAAQVRASVVWNNRCWFAGIVGNMDLDIIYDRASTFTFAMPSLTVTAGWRFNLW